MYAALAVAVVVAGHYGVSGELELAAGRPRVEVGNATLVGTVNGTLKVFAGLPYATSERFGAPVRSVLEGEIDASTFGPPCLQYGLEDDIIGSEACLSLNVFAPRASGAPRAVMVFIHGGGLTSGAATTYDFKELASGGDVVVVSIQYRLSWAGWLSVPGALPPRNVGLLDQIEALRWVRDHCAAFGGDPGRVTIFGQSAGGTSVLLLAASREARGLFSRAIAQSPWWAGKQIGGLSTEEAADLIWGECYCDVVDCSADGAAVLRRLAAANATELTRACGYMVAVVPDGGAVPSSLMGDLCDADDGDDPFLDALRDRNFELLVGSNENEYRYWAMGLGNATATLDSLEDSLLGYVADEMIPLLLGLRWNATTHLRPTPGWTEACAADALADFLERISAYDAGTPALDAIQFTTDAWFTVPTSLAASAGRGSGPKRARYLNAHPVNATTTVPLETMHCAELPYVLGFDGFTWRYNNSDERAVKAYYHAPTEDMRRTKDFFQAAWLTFAKRGFVDDDGWPAAASRDGEPYAYLHAVDAVDVKAGPPAARAGYEFARALYCDTEKLASDYLAACKARAAS